MVIDVAGGAAFNALLEPGINAQMAAAYLKALYEATPEKDWEEALASYVMGPQAVKDQPHWRASNPKIQEYVTAIMRNWGGPNVPGLSRRGLQYAE